MRISNILSGLGVFVLAVVMYEHGLDLMPNDAVRGTVRGVVWCLGALYLVAGAWGLVTKDTDQQ